MKVHRLTMHSQTLSLNNLDDLIETIRIEIENLDKDEGLDLYVETVEMTQKEYDDLPEFEGF